MNHLYTINKLPTYTPVAVAMLKRIARGQGNVITTEDIAPLLAKLEKAEPAEEHEAHVAGKSTLAEGSGGRVDLSTGTRQEASPTPAVVEVAVEVKTEVESNVADPLAGLTGIELVKARAKLNKAKG